MGQHVPRLEFLRILLGNEPVLEPQEQLYHQLLAGEAIQAAKEADRWIGERTFENYLDEVAIPSFRIASDDQKRAALGREQMNELNGTIAEYIQLVKESLDFKREQQAAAIAAKPDGARRSATALILAGRGSLDLAASELIADAIRLDLGIVVRCPSLGGLTGIGAAAEAAPEEHPDIIALVSVGAVTPAQLDLLLRRVKRSFPRSRRRRILGKGRRTRGTERSLRAPIRRIQSHPGRIADEQPSAAGPARRLEAVAGE
jgi:hypothetical protein